MGEAADSDEPGEKHWHSKVEAWVEESGRALELRTARALTRADTYMVFQSPYYEDPKTSVRREGDVLAMWRWRLGRQIVTLDLAVECKWSKDIPWVAFYDHHEKVPELPHSWFVVENTDRRDRDAVRAAMEAWISRPALVTDRAATHVVSAGLGTRSENKGNKAQDAVLQSLSFAKAKASTHFHAFEDPPEDTRIKLAVPVVVTQAPLFTCELSPSGEVDLKQVSRFDVMVDDGPRQARRRVFVRSESSFEGMLRGVNRVRATFDPV